MSNTSGVGIASMIVGILSIIFVWIPVLNVLLAIAAIVCGIISLSSIRKDPKIEGKGMAISGIVMGGVAILFSIIFLVGMLAFFSVLSPSDVLPERTVFANPIIAYDSQATAATNSIEVAFTNNLGSSITVPMTTEVISENCLNPTMSGAFKGSPLTRETIIANGEGFLLKWTCQGTAEVGDEFNAEITFDYINAENGLAKKESGSVWTTYK